VPPLLSVYIDWRQGDYATCAGARFFVFLGHGGSAEDALFSNEQGAISAKVDDVQGLVVVSQSCDVVRDICDNPFVEVAPLTPVNPDIMEEVRRLKRPRYIYIPGAAKHGLVADLGRAMTIRKELLQTWTRQVGCDSDEQVITLQGNFAYRRLQFGFPAEFVSFFSKCRELIKTKAKANSPDGHGLARVSEIRVLATPSWAAANVSLTFYFFVDSAADITNPEVVVMVNKCVAKLQPSAQFAKIEHIILTLADLTAAEYLAAPRLDLDQASIS
jgi:hypothetical protein